MTFASQHDLITLAERQHGLVARWQAEAVGVDRRRWYRLANSADWHAPTPSVLRRRGSPTDARQRALVGVFDSGEGAALYGRSAAAAWRIPGFRLGRRPEVVRARAEAQRPSDLAVVHTSVRFGPEHVRVMDGLPVTTPAQTIFDLARSEHPARVERALDAALSRRLVCGSQLHATLRAVAISGRDGVVLMRTLLEERGPDYVPPASGLEHRFAQLLEDAAEPPMHRQVDLGGEDWIGRVDFRDRELPLVVEINSEMYHAALVDRRADAVRYEKLKRAGFTVVAFWDWEVWSEGHDLVRRVREIRSALRRGAEPTILVCDGPQNWGPSPVEIR